ncbi:MAG: hypothetical protein MJZ99_09860 [Bacteroidales bacterium]|nr:hypothetical protein [Bacteroidales bacterium]
MDANICQYLEQFGLTFVCDIFSTWEPVKDELLIADRKSGSGNGTVHVFLGTSGYKFLESQYPKYYQQVISTNDTDTGAPSINHIFLKSNLFSLLGNWTNYHFKKSGKIPLDKYSELSLFFENKDNMSFPEIACHFFLG